MHDSFLGKSEIFKVLNVFLFNLDFLDSKALPRKLWKFLHKNQKEPPHDTGGKLPSLTPHIYHVDIIAHLKIYVNENIILRHKSLTILKFIKVKITF